MCRIQASCVLMAIGLVLLAPTAGVGATMESTPLTKGSPASSQKTLSSGTDSGLQDPVDFPRPPGLVRKSYSQTTATRRSEEVATYHSAAGFDETVALYRDDLQAAGWKKLSDSDSGSGLNRLRMIDWKTPTQDAEIRFYATRGDGTDLRVRVFTYKTSQTDKLVQSGSGAAQAADAAVVKTAPAAKVDTAKATELSKKSGAAPVGSPPTNFQVHSYNPAFHQLSWQASSWTSFDLWRKGTADWIRIAEQIETQGFIDYSLVVPNSIYRVVVKHLDGSEGALEFTYANPPQPKMVEGLTAIQTGPNKVKVTWQQLPGVPTYQIFGPGLPESGSRVWTLTSELTGVHPGNHTVRVAALYGDGGSHQVVAPNAASADVIVLKDRGRYRIVFLGLHCEHETKDDMLQLDGKRDEVYAGAYTVRVTRQSTTATPPAGSLVRTKVMGDTNGFSGRIQAGTASDAGGIQTGDFVPSSAATVPQPGVATTTDRFPLLVWEGELSDSSDLLVIAPVLFAWNKADESPWNSWSGWWSSPNGAAQLRDSARQGVKPDKLGLTLSGEWQRDKWAGGYIDPLAGSFDFLDPDRKRRYGPGFDLKADRPIGLEDQHGGGMLNAPDLVWAPRGLVLTRTNLEAKLGSQNAVVYQWGFIDDSLSNAALEGDYRIYIQIERLTSPP